MKKWIMLSLILFCKGLSAQMWSDTSASYFFTIQYRPLDFYYNLSAADVGLYYYNPAHEVHFSIKGGGGTYYPKKEFSSCESNSLFVKPGIFIASNRQAEKLQITLGLTGIYSYEKQSIQSIHIDPFWGDLKKTYNSKIHKFGAALELAFFLRITRAFQGVISLQSNYNFYDSATIKVFNYFPGGGFPHNNNFNVSLGLIYKLNK
ncbi:MAG: hypothetical protein H7296_06665 [Bacteroidia bacterium]|nr:hypothetical protein [Bacteroidia bacterium]